MSAIRENYVSVKLSPDAHTALIEEERRRCSGNEHGISHSAMIRTLIEEVNSQDGDDLDDLLRV